MENVKIGNKNFNYYFDFVCFVKIRYQKNLIIIIQQGKYC